MIPLIVGAALAAGAGAANAYSSYKDREAAADAYDKIQGLADEANSANQADIAAYKKYMQDTYGTGAASYQKALDDFLNSEVFRNKDFAYVDENGNPITVANFMDPYANQRWQAEMDTINNASASGGNRFSSDYVNRVGARAQAHTSEEYEKAYNKLMQDRQAQLATWQANSQNGWNNYNATQDRLKSAVDVYGNDRNMLAQGIADTTMANMNNRNANLQTQASVMGGIANTQMGNNFGGYASQILGPAASFMGSYFGSK